MSGFPEAPLTMKSIQPYLRIASDHDKLDLIVAYWARVYSLQLGIKTSKLADEKGFLLTLMDWLENVKKTNKDNEAISNDTVAQAYLENYAHKIFTVADQQDRASNFDKNIVRRFFTSAKIYDIISTFGELSEEAAQNRKYAAWKAAYINNCIKNGETPHPGPLPVEGEDGGIAGASGSFGWNSNPNAHQPPAPGPYPPPGNYQPPSSGSYQPPPNYQPNSPQAPSNNDNLPFHLPDPPKDPEPKNPGGFVPYTPSASSVPAYEPTQSGSVLSPEQIAKAQKYCKYIQSALTYDDVPTAINNLQKCLNLLQTGKDS